MVIDVPEGGFESEVATCKLPVLLDFWGPQCKPCIALMPTVDELAQRFTNELKVVKVNSGNHRKLCMQLKVLSLPTFLFFKGGKELGRLTGNEISRDQLVSWVERAMSEATV